MARKKKPESSASDLPRVDPPERVPVLSRMLGEMPEAIRLSFARRRTRRRLLALGFGSRGCSAAFQTSLVGLLSDSGIVDSTFIDAILDLDEAGASVRHFLASFGSRIELVAEQSAASGLDREISDALTVCGYEFTSDLGAGDPPEEADSDILATVGLGVAAAFVDAFGYDPVEAERFLSRVLGETAWTDRQKADLSDYVIAISANSGFHPAAPFLHDRLLDEASAAVARSLKRDAACRPIREDAVDRALREACDAAVRDGFVRILWDSSFDHTVLEDSVIRTDMTLALASDMLVAAHLDGLTLADLSRALAAVIKARIAKGAGLRNPGLADGTGNTVLDDVDPDLATVCIFCRWPSEAERLPGILLELHRHGFTLADLCAQCVVAEALGTREDIDSGMMAALEAGGLVAHPPAGECTSPWLSVLAASLSPAPREEARRNFLSVAMAAIGASRVATGPDAHIATLLPSPDDGHSVTCSMLLGLLTSVEEFRSVSPASFPNGEYDVFVAAAGIALGAARFLCDNPDEVDEELPPAYRLTTGEIAYIAADDLAREPAPGSFAADDPVGAGVVSSATETRDNMDRLLTEFPERRAEIDFFTLSRNRAAPDCCSAHAASSRHDVSGVLSRTLH